MKKIIPLSLSLMFFVSCSPVGNIATISETPSESVNATENQPEALNADNLNEQVEYFDFMLLNQANNVLRPVLPQDIESLKINGKELSTSDLFFPGTNETERYIDNETNRMAEMKKVVKGENMGLFAGSGKYAFFIKASDQNTAIDIKLKGQSESYRILRLENMKRGTFVLQDGKVSGSFNTDGNFELKQFSADDLSTAGALVSVFANFSAFFNSGNFDISSFTNSYFSEGLEVKVTTNTGQVLQFNTPEEVNEDNQDELDQGQELDASEGEEVEQAAQETAELLASNSDYLQGLLPFEGSWEPESLIIQGLIPGQKLIITFEAGAEGKIEVSAETATNSYSHTASVSEIMSATESGDVDQLNFDLSSGDKEMAVEVSLENSNRMKVVLTATNVDEFSSLVNQNVFLSRVN